MLAAEASVPAEKDVSIVAVEPASEALSLTDPASEARDVAASWMEAGHTGTGGGGGGEGTRKPLGAEEPDGPAPCM